MIKTLTITWFTVILGHLSLSKELVPAVGDSTVDTSPFCSWAITMMAMEVVMVMVIIMIMIMEGDQNEYLQPV